MRNFNKDNKFGSRPMYKATCSECGRECQVPFRPTGDRDVFCSDCFGKQQGDTRFEKPRGGRFERSSFERPSFEKRKFEATCDKCGRTCEVPFKPSGERPVYCNQCFGKDVASTTPSKGNDQLKGQLEALNNKLDKILKLLTPALAVEEPQPIKEKKKAKTTKKKK